MGMADRRERLAEFGPGTKSLSRCDLARGDSSDRGSEQLGPDLVDDIEHLDGLGERMDAGLSRAGRDRVVHVVDNRGEAIDGY